PLAPRRARPRARPPSLRRERVPAGRAADRGGRARDRSLPPDRLSALALRRGVAEHARRPRPARHPRGPGARRPERPRPRSLSARHGPLRSGPGGVRRTGRALQGSGRARARVAFGARRAPAGPPRGGRRGRRARDVAPARRGRRHRRRHVPRLRERGREGRVAPARDRRRAAVAEGGMGPHGAGGERVRRAGRRGRRARPPRFGARRRDRLPRSRRRPRGARRGDRAGARRCVAARSAVARRARMGRALSVGRGRGRARRGAARGCGADAASGDARLPRAGERRARGRDRHAADRGARVTPGARRLSASGETAPAHDGAAGAVRTRGARAPSASERAAGAPAAGVRARVAPRAWAATAAVALAALAIFLAFVGYGFNLDDEGNVLYQILRTYRGERPYLDFHTGYTPAMFYLNAALFRLFGVSVIPVRVGLALVNALATALTFRLALRVARPAEAACAALAYALCMPFFAGQFASFNIPYPAWYAVAAWLGAELASVRAAESGRRSPLLAAGVLAGVAFSFKPNTGILCLGAAVLAQL